MLSRHSQQHLWQQPEELGMGMLSLCSFIGYRDSREPLKSPFVSDIGAGSGD